MIRRFKIVLEPDPEEGGYTVTVPSLPGCVTEGDTIEECIEQAKEAIKVTIEDMKDEGLPIPAWDVIVNEVTAVIGSEAKRFKIVLEPDLEEGGFVVTVPSLPGCVTQGETVEECIGHAREAIEVTIEGLRAGGSRVPLVDILIHEVEVNIDP